MLRQISPLALSVAFLCGCGRTPEPIATNTASEAKTLKASYGRLTIDSVQQRGEAADLSGSTDLPDGSDLRAEIALYTQDPKATYVGNGLDVKTKGGRWTASIPFPQVAGFVKGPHEASVMFTPKSQTHEVLALVGENGEQLVGENTSAEYNFRVAQATKRVSLSVAKRAASMPRAESFGSDDPRRALASLLGRWKARDWSALARDATLTMDSTVAERRIEADNHIGFMNLESAAIGKVERTGLIARVNANVAYSIGSKLHKETMGFVFLRTNGHANLTPSGRWRANIGAVRAGGF